MWTIIHTCRQKWGIKSISWMKSPRSWSPVLSLNPSYQILKYKLESFKFLLDLRQLCCHLRFPQSWQKRIMEPVVHTILILTVRHTTCKGILYTYLHRCSSLNLFGWCICGQDNCDYDPSADRHCCQSPACFSGSNPVALTNHRSPASARPWSRWHLQKNSWQKRCLLKYKKRECWKCHPLD